MVVRSLLISLLAILAFVPTAYAQENEAVVTEKARVLEVLRTDIKTVPGTETTQEYQTLSALLLSGPNKGATVTVENDYLSLEPGDVFYLTHQTPGSASGYEQYAVSEPYRLPALLVLVGVFVAAVVLVGGVTGIRGLIALALSLFFILYALLPGILAGYDPTLVALLVASIIVILGSYLTHGVNRTTSAAVIGMLATLVLTSGIAYVAIRAAKLSGFGDESAVYLNFATNGNIDFVGLLFGGLLIGILGILYDAAIGQAVAVEELVAAAPHASMMHIFKRAMRIGREHIGALVNTLAIAYVGATLPLLLLFSSYADEPILQTINREMFATEIVRACVGSIGIVLAVPVATFAAVLLLMRFSRPGATVRSHGHHHT